MTLLELCEPLFQCICRLNRSARKGGNHDMTQVRSEINAIFNDMKSKSASDAYLSEQYEKIHLPLIFFVDLMIRDSQLSFANDWQGLACELGELAGDEKFFDYLEETFIDQKSAATERLAVFYTCLGLGFDGFYVGQNHELQKLMVKCSARIANLVDSDDAIRICPDAYANVDTSDLIEPPGRKLAGIGIAFIGLIILLFVTNILLYRWHVDQLSESLENVVEHKTKAIVDE